MKRVQWTRVAVAGAVLVAVVGFGIYALPDHAGSVTTSIFVETPEGTTDIGKVLPRTLTLSRQNQTVGRVLEENGVSHGQNEVADIFNGQVAVQTEEDWAFVKQHWNITVTNRNTTIPLTELDDLVVRDGDRLRFTYHRRVTGRTPLPNTPDFITVVSRDAARNGQGRTDYISCVNNKALHDWEKRFQKGRADTPDYPFNPPVCGAHLHQFPGTGEHNIPHERGAYIRDEPITPIPSQLHILGHGMTIIQYHPDQVDRETVQQLEEWTREHPFVFVAPYPDIDRPIVLTRWGMTATLQEFNRTKLEQFQQAPFNIIPPMGSPTYLPPLNGQTLQFYHVVLPSHLSE